jgi:hypothetical protein
VAFFALYHHFDFVCVFEHKVVSDPPNSSSSFPHLHDIMMKRFKGGEVSLLKTLELKN